MNKLLIALITAVSFSVSAKSDTEIINEYCDVIGKTASGIMTSRQKGTSIMPMLKIFKKEVSRQLVLEAYDSPKYGTYKHKQQSITEFSNKAVIKCLKGFK